MATGGVRTLQFVVVLTVFVRVFGSLGSEGVEKFLLPEVKWEAYNPVITVGRATLLQLRVSDNSSSKSLLIALTTKLEEEGSSCSTLSTPPLHPRIHTSPKVLHLHLRSYQTQKLEEGPAWLCISYDGQQWIHLGPSSKIYVQSGAHRALQRRSTDQGPPLDPLYSLLSDFPLGSDVDPATFDSGAPAWPHSVHEEVEAGVGTEVPWSKEEVTGVNGTVEDEGPIDQGGSAQEEEAVTPVPEVRDVVISTATPKLVDSGKDVVVGGIRSVGDGGLVLEGVGSDVRTRRESGEKEVEERENELPDDSEVDDKASAADSPATSAITRDTRTNAKIIESNLQDEIIGKTVLNLMNEDPKSLPDVSDETKPPSEHLKTNDTSAFKTSFEKLNAGGASVPLEAEVFGFRVEYHSKSVDLDDAGVGSLLADSPALLRLFGTGLSTETEILFTAEPADRGDSCTIKTSAAFLIYEAGQHFGLAEVSLPPMTDNQERWYMCVRRVNSPLPAIHQGSVPWLSVTSYKLGIPLWIQVCMLIVLLLLSGLFSGLNLGLMALDKTELKIVSNTGTPTEQRYARAIEPVRRHGNFLLCTLLLGNVLVNSTLTILLDGLTSGLVAVIGSTIGIVLFGEIIPQAICSRHGLAIGARTVWLVRVFMVLTFIVAWPISKMLDLLLGEELGNTYDRERLKELIKVTHGQNDLQADEQNIICGALEMHKKTVKEVMTPIDDVYMIDIDSLLDFNTIDEIMQHGYSRVPVFENERNNIVSVLFVKELAYVDPDENTPLRTLSNFYQNPLLFVFEDTTLDNIFKEFKEGSKGHLALVQRINNEGDCDPFYEIVGLVTLEDVIEELIQSEIVDETDRVTDNVSKRRRNNRTGRRDFTQFSTQLQQGGPPRKLQVSPQMLVACYQYLRTSLDPFKEDMMSENILKRLLTQDVIECIKIKEKDNSNKDPLTFLYTKGKATDFFVLVLEGHVEVTIGRENLTFESGPFTYFGYEALCSSSSIGESPSACTQLSRSSGPLASSVQSLDTKFSFAADYSVRAITEVTFLKLRRSQYVAARKAYLLEKSQKEGGGEDGDQFDSDMARIMNEEEGLASPAWENTSLPTPNSKEFVGNGLALVASDGTHDNLELSLTGSDAHPLNSSPLATPAQSGSSTRAPTPKTEPPSQHNRSCKVPPPSLPVERSSSNGSSARPVGRGLANSSPGSPVIAKPPRASLAQFGSHNQGSFGSLEGRRSMQHQHTPRRDSREPGHSTSAGSNLDTDDGAQSLHTSPSGTGPQVSPVSKDIPSDDTSPLEGGSEAALPPPRPRAPNKGRLTKHESIS